MRLIPSPSLPRLVACCLGMGAALAWGWDGESPVKAESGAALQGVPSTPLDSLEVSPGSEPRVLAALDRGLAYLAAQQRKGTTGALPCTPGDNHAPVGITALAALAWIGGGSNLTRGPYMEELGRAIDYLLDGQVQDGERKGYFTQTGDQVSQTHGHGLATLALAQAFTISPRSARGARIELALRSACDRILAAQGVDGGWYYTPTPSVQQEGSVTVALVWALRGAKDAGIYIPVEPIDRAVAYVKSLQQAGGGFQYSATRPNTSVALTAAALSTLHATGTYEGKEIDEGYAYIWRELAGRDIAGESGREERVAFPFYERLYLAQALYQHKDLTHFWNWSNPLREELIRSQEPDGSWSDRRMDPSGAWVQNQYGKSYATAVNCLVLSIPHSTLPIFTR
ncbi:MAG: terpene cyclase/mutase family protein [Planctomycetes bacterium]|nr:terpene cyclase/mutase family protein [Planctomycetota bacterium]MCB9912472.1 terpene cyclase/mutase family protein [Planctomycetota bacterium]